MSERDDERDDIWRQLEALRAEGARQIAELQQLRQRMDADRARLDDALTRTRAAWRRLQEDERGDEGDEASGALGVRQPVPPRGPCPRTDAIALKEPR